MMDATRRPQSKVLERAKVIGRIAYVHVRDAAMCGNMGVDGEEKRFSSLSKTAPRSRWRLRSARTLEPTNIFEIRWDRPAASRSSTSIRAYTAPSLSFSDVKVAIKSRY